MSENEFSLEKIIKGAILGLLIGGGLVLLVGLLSSPW